MTNGIPRAIQIGLEHHQAGRFAEAERAYRKFLRSEPNHPAVLHLLGVVAAQAGKFEAAVEWLDKAIAIKPDFAEALSDRGNVLKELKRIDEAIASFDRAVAIKPDFVEALSNRGTALHAVGRYEEALASYDRALATRPDYADAWYNRANALHAIARADDAIASYDQALALQPYNAAAWTARGMALANPLRRYDEALASWDQSLAINPDDAEVLTYRGIVFRELGFALLDQGDLARAMKAALGALRASENAQSKLLFCECLRYSGPDACDPEDIEAVHGLALRALSESWTRPGELAPACHALLMRNPALRDVVAGGARVSAGAGLWPLLASDRLFLCLLKSTTVPNMAFERFLAGVRGALLDAAAIAPSDDVLACASALAQQCFINEYVFDVEPDEFERATRLREEVAAALASGAPVQALPLMTVAAYFPLHALPGASRLLQCEWPAAASELLRQQLAEPAEEARLREGIPRLTPIGSDVSAAVREQYEQNPYPRWVKAPPAIEAASIDAYLQQQFPSASFSRLGKSGAFDILIAGCGTGQHAIATAGQFPQARVLAIDLSLASLGYASRKTREAGMRNLEYAQADILQLGRIDQRFDVIESVGVLHHLADPMQGWRVLLGLLRPRGFMRLGFYSELARQDFAPARAFAAHGNGGRTADDIRRCRQALMAGGPDSAAGSVLGKSDFYSMSGCRDLLFHVQEHRLTLPQIAAFLQENQLGFIGFQTDPHTIRAYREMFPEDRAMNDLALWDRFERERPATFSGMYQFWVQKIGG